MWMLTSLIYREETMTIDLNKITEEYQEYLDSPARRVLAEELLDFLNGDLTDPDFVSSDQVLFMLRRKLKAIIED